MKKSIELLAMIAILAICMAGCISTAGQQRIDALMERLVILDNTIKEKAEKHETGELTTKEAEESVREARDEIKAIKDEFKAIRAEESADWKDMAGAVILSILGSLGGVRLWRGGINSRQGTIPTQ
jgi:hypothetical protein